MKIDLQIHTTHSDGRNTPREIIGLAKRGGLGVIAITDHDTVSSIKECSSEAKKFGIKVIPAVEITTGYRKKPLHVLGYGIDMTNPQFVSFLNKIAVYRKRHFIKQIPRLNKNLTEKGKRLVDIKKYSHVGPKYYSIPGLALFVYEEKIVEGRNDGFYYLRGISDVAPPVNPRDAFAIIHKAGGKAFLSHPFAPLISLKEIIKDKKEQDKIISNFKKQGMDGLECYQTGHNSKDIDFILSLSKKYGLLISAGSDWHGSLNQTGKTIKEYLPYYLKKLGNLVVPKRKVKEILTGILQ